MLAPIEDSGLRCFVERLPEETDKRHLRKSNTPGKAAKQSDALSQVGNKTETPLSWRTVNCLVLVTHSCTVFKMKASTLDAATYNNICQNSLHF